MESFLFENGKLKSDLENILLDGGMINWNNKYILTYTERYPNNPLQEWSGWLLETFENGEVVYTSRNSNLSLILTEMWQQISDDIYKKLNDRQSKKEV